eukprot:TRINITY_DN320_c0_g2_i1.p1 TRINITY_DN320_c0_g2~~TRINITY_DN320_c0_g2_i1.p1  ORF type:complete len:425 (-),score=69.91 TRINITY_DN320_c0_g2_i1:79-1353(-)
MTMRSVYALGLFVLFVSAQDYYCTTGASVRIRSTPCVETNNIVTTLEAANTRVVSVQCCTAGCNYSWRKVTSSFGNGWIADSFLQKCSAPPSPSTISMVTGRYEPVDYPELYGTVSSYGIPGSGYLRHETLRALKSMYTAFNAANPSIPFTVVSALRNFNSQRTIWEGKWTGSYSHIVNPLDRGLAILTFSSMPGTSRHHWGTDVDLTDLNPSYWTKGQGLIFYNWMNTNAPKYGFLQPYTSGRTTGYSEERWHWSFANLSRTFVQNWVDNKDAILVNLAGSFSGFDQLKTRAITYVTSINPSLLPTSLKRVQPSEFGTFSYCANQNTSLLNGPCSNETVVTSIETNAIFKSLSCCIDSCNGTFRFGTFGEFGEQVGYVDDSALTACFQGTELVEDSDTGSDFEMSSAPALFSFVLIVLIVIAF